MYHIKGFFKFLAILAYCVALMKNTLLRPPLIELYLGKKEVHANFFLQFPNIFMLSQWIRISSFDNFLRNGLNIHVN